MVKKIGGYWRCYCVLALLLFLPVCSRAMTAEPEQDQNADWRHRVAQDPAWQAYFQRSEAFAAQDQLQLEHELKALQQTKASKPLKHKQFGFTPVPSRAYLQSPDASRVAKVILSFQTPSGGWSKRTDMANKPRQAGQQFGVEKNYIPTFDNGATTTQLRWLAAFYPYAPTSLKHKVQAALIKGVKFVLAAQYPNGGFAQTYPLQGGYHDAITLNDHVQVELLKFLQDSAQHADFQMLPVDLKLQAQRQFALGVQLLLQSQVVLKQNKTVWAAQYHPVTLTPVSARAYEKAALASSESAGVVLFLMQQQPTEALTASIQAAVTWFEHNKILDTKVVRDQHGMRLVAYPGAKPLWARFYDLEQQLPLFVDRDGNIKATVNELSLERQLGYGWYQHDAAEVLKHYPSWCAKAIHAPCPTTPLHQ